MAYQNEHQASSSPVPSNKNKRNGTAFERKIINEWEDRRVSLNEKYGESPAKIICGYEKLIQQMAESKSPGKSQEKVIPYHCPNHFLLISILLKVLPRSKQNKPSVSNHHSIEKIKK